MGTLKTSIQRKNVNYSTEKHLKDELKHIRKIILIRYIQNLFKEIKEITSSGMENQVEAKNTSIKNCLWVLQYEGEKGTYC